MCGVLWNSWLDSRTNRNCSHFSKCPPFTLNDCSWFGSTDQLKVQQSPLLTPGCRRKISLSGIDTKVFVQSPSMGRHMQASLNCVRSTGRQECRVRGLLPCLVSALWIQSTHLLGRVSGIPAAIFHAASPLLRAQSAVCKHNTCLVNPHEQSCWMGLKF